MNNKNFVLNIMKTVLILVICAAANCAAIMMNSYSSYEGTSQTVMMIRHYIGDFLMLAVPVLLGRFLLKTLPSRLKNILSVILPGIAACVLMTVLIIYYASDDGIGFIIAFMNAPGYLLSAIFNQFYNSNSVLYLSVGLNPLLETTLISIGFLWKIGHDKYKKSAKSIPAETVVE